MRAAVDAELGERALVDQQRQALARGELFLRVLARDLLLPAAELDLRAPRFEVLHQRSQQRGLLHRGHQPVPRGTAPPVLLVAERGGGISARSTAAPASRRTRPRPPRCPPWTPPAWAARAGS